VNRFLHLARAALLSLALALPVVSASALAEGDAKTASTKHYVCPACAAPCDSLVFDAPGTCPQCGMALIEQAAAVKAAAETPPAKRVGILVFDNVEIIDFTGPYEMFGTAGYDVYTVAATKDPITTAMGLKLIPQYSFADAPAPDVLLVPGGGVRGAQSSEPTLAWVREASAHSQHTLSVCNGAFILAQAGLLDGLTATTTAHLIEQLHAKFPKVNVVRDRRFVDNGKIVTAAGLSSGIDGALHVLSVMEGGGLAQQFALSALNAVFIVPEAPVAQKVPINYPDLGELLRSAYAMAPQHRTVHKTSVNPYSPAVNGGGSLGYNWDLENDR